MAERHINPIVKQVLELGPTLAFFVIYLRIKDAHFVIGGTSYSGFIVATLAFIPVLLIAMGVLWRLSGRLSRMQVLTALMVIVFGGLTAYLNDERFFKMKTTIIYGLFALILAFGLLRRQSYLQYVMGELLPMQDEGWMKLTRRQTVMFALLAIGNEVVWRTQSTDLWVKIETFGFPLALFLFLWLQIVLLQRYLIEEDTAGGD
ncbi:MAG: septation protein A [Limimaricola sp.]|uniref:inner membrane-spanning protein YciB n=1 Tax=Limimaricola sp. TaxID=2211665 RepID=UPI001E1330C0|nr:inner membrane-spanning protein YciB [Limimaricola sp.]MBI1416163.1 septation protein A [Limimaricola sp.]